MAADLKVKLFRYDPSSSAPPRYDEFTVPRIPDMRILDALNYVFDNDKEQSIAHRWYCGTKKCGECAVTVNGRPMLTCWEPAEDEMTCEPLANFPIIRDLVVDTKPYERLIVDLRPYLTRKSKPAEIPERIAASKMAGANHLSKCIECNACTAAVPARDFNADGIDWSGYAGPAALVRFSRFALDPRDETHRRPYAERAGLNEFPHHTILHEICPQGIDIIADALVPASKRLFGTENGAKPDIDTASTTPLIVARNWSAFVRLEEARRRELVDGGRLKALSLPNVPDAYSLVEG